MCGGVCGCDVCIARSQRSGAEPWGRERGREEGRWEQVRGEEREREEGRRRRGVKRGEVGSQVKSFESGRVNKRGGGRRDRKSEAFHLARRGVERVKEGNVKRWRGRTYPEGT